MRRKRVLGIVVGVTALAGIAGGWMGLWSQGTRPEAGPFNASQIMMQTEPAQGWAVRAGRLFDPKSGTNLTNQVILIKGGKITDVGSADKVQIPQGASVIDLRNATVLPGLIDRHVHLFQDPQPNDGRAFAVGLNYALKDLSAGFTTLQDMGSPYTYASVELRDAINKGLVPGPRLQVAGPQLNPRGATYYPAPGVVAPFGQAPGNRCGSSPRTSTRRGWPAPLCASTPTTARTGSRSTRPRIMKAAVTLIQRDRERSRQTEK